MLKYDEQSHTNVLGIYSEFIHVIYFSFVHALGVSTPCFVFGFERCLKSLRDVNFHEENRPDSQRENWVWLTPRSIENNIQNFEQIDLTFNPISSNKSQQGEMGQVVGWMRLQLAVGESVVKTKQLR